MIYYFCVNMVAIDSSDLLKKILSSGIIIDIISHDKQRRIILNSKKQQCQI